MANGSRNSIYASVASQEGATGGAAEHFQGLLIGFENVCFFRSLRPKYTTLVAQNFAYLSQRMEYSLKQPPVTSSHLMH